MSFNAVLAVLQESIFFIVPSLKCFIFRMINKIFLILIERKILVEEKYTKIFSILIERKIFFNSTLSIKYKIIKS